jgi:hypothetical protein
MSDSNNDFVTVSAKANPIRDYGTKQQVRMELMLSSESKRVNIAGVLTEFVKRATSASIPTRIFDIHDAPVRSTSVPSGDDFISRFSVAKIEKGKSLKVVLGFYLQSTMTLNELKTAVDRNWLQQQQIYLRPQRMSFEHGTDLFLLGYLVQEHPFTANLDQLEADTSAKWFSPLHTRNTIMTDDDAQDTSYDELVTALTQQQIITNGKLMIPITAEKTVVKVKAPGKEMFETPLICIYVPRKYHEAATLLNDFSINNQDDLSLIPFSLSKNQPDQFYYHMTKHAEFLHVHRNIQIISVTLADYQNLSVPDPSKPLNDQSNQTLAQLLSSNPMIHRIYPHPTLDKIQVSVLGADHFPLVGAWLDTILPLFPYGPTRQLPMHSTASPRSSTPLLLNKIHPKGKEKYANKFAIPTDIVPEFDPCSTPSFRSSRKFTKKNAWANGPPTELVYDATEIMEFPPLATIHTTDTPSDYVNGGYGPGNTTQPTQAGVPERIDTIRGATRGRTRGGRGNGRIPQNTNPSSTDNPTTLTSPSPSVQPTPPDHNQPDPTSRNIDEIIAQAVAKSTAKILEDMQATQAKFTQLEQEIAQLHQIIIDNVQAVASKTSDATISALTGPTSPFVTKEDYAHNQQQHAQTQVQIGHIQTSLDRLLDAVYRNAHRDGGNSPLTQDLQTPPRERKVPRLSSIQDFSPTDVDESPADSTNTDHIHQEDDMAVDSGVGEY